MADWALPVLGFTLSSRVASLWVKKSQPKPASDDSFVCDRSIPDLVGIRNLTNGRQTSEHGPGSGVSTIVPLNVRDGIVDFHDFFVESYWIDGSQSARA